MSDRDLIRQFAFDIVMTEFGGDDQDADDQAHVTENVDAWMEHWDQISKAADPDTLIITKTDGEWPDWVLDAWTKTGGSATGYFTMLDALLEGQSE